MILNSPKRTVKYYALLSKILPQRVILTNSGCLLVAVLTNFTLFTIVAVINDNLTCNDSSIL